jgi:hypothetical protein
MLWLLLLMLLHPIADMCVCVFGENCHVNLQQTLRLTSNDVVVSNNSVVVVSLLVSCVVVSCKEEEEKEENTQMGIGRIRNGFVYIIIILLLLLLLLL